MNKMYSLETNQVFSGLRAKGFHNSKDFITSAPRDPARLCSAAVNTGSCGMYWDDFEERRGEN